ncbi:MAG: TetR/AcrR family transcriptional regulator [Spirochaetales bacterium]|nr:TetR/AcrR family transcriptional regulator [Spirochaetales bacterium]
MKEANQQQAVFLAALELFSLRGFDGVSMRDIARQADCSVSLIYNYYPSKAELLQAILFEAQAQVAATLALLAGPGSAGALLAAYLDAVVEVLEGNRMLWRVVHLLRMQRHLFPLEDIRHFQERTLKVLQGLLHEAGVPEATAAGQAVLLFAAIDGLTAQYLLDDTFPLRSGARACTGVFTKQKGVKNDERFTT